MKQCTDTPHTTDATNAELARNVQEALFANRRGFQRISVEAEAGMLHLTGTVGSFFLRQSAIALTNAMLGTRHVVDDLVVDGKHNFLKGLFMEAPAITIYHCITCGRMERDEVGTNPPECCGHAMTKAVTEKPPESNVVGDLPLDTTEPNAESNKEPTKPR